MGCDIHIQIERRVEGRWEIVPYVDAWSAKWRKRFWQPGEVVMPETFTARNYDLFGVLADVCNGTWGEPNPPIAQPRGFPLDMVNRPTDDEEREPWLGDHSFSWVTLSELQAYPWDHMTRKRGWVSHEVAAQFRRDGIPPTSYGAGGNHGEYIEWEETIRKDCRNWIDTILPMLEALGKPDDVRLVFGFDS